jgi:addiction module RelE/StbE family toxin
MKVEWTNRALAHLLDIYEYIAQDSPMYAKRTIDNLTRRSEQIGQHPQSGRVVPEYETDDIREVIEGEYRLIYRIKPDQIDVIAVVHSRRNITN